MRKLNTVVAKAEHTPGPPLPAMFDRYRDGLEGELKAALSVPHGDSVQEDLPLGLYTMLQYHMGWADESGRPLAVPLAQGKALRPTLCLFACEALNEDWATVLPAASALEFVHNFSLIHDDIQDGDLERRHRPTVWSLWGQPQALLAGNAIRQIADITALGLADRGVPAEKALRASFLLTRGYLEMTRGQCMDLVFEGSLDIRLEDYLAMISWKTGALLRYGMEMGALVASDQADFVQAFAHCGSFLGLAFQIRDDVLGTWGDEATTGKAVGNDIRRRKKTFPIVYALQVAGDPARRKLVDAYSKSELDDRDADDVLTVLEELNVAEYAQEVTRQRADRALEELDCVPLSSWARREIEDLVDFLTTRQY